MGRVSSHSLVEIQLKRHKIRGHSFIYTLQCILLSCDTECDSAVCSRAVLNGHKAVQCDGCELWIHNECSFISEDDYDNVLTTRCTWICPKCDFFNFSDSFFDDQLNLMTQNRFDPL